MVLYKLKILIQNTRDAAGRAENFEFSSDLKIDYDYEEYEEFIALSL